MAARKKIPELKCENMLMISIEFKKSAHFLRQDGPYQLAGIMIDTFCTLFCLLSL